MTANAGHRFEEANQRRGTRTLSSTRRMQCSLLTSPACKAVHLPKLDSTSLPAAKSTSSLNMSPASHLLLCEQLLCAARSPVCLETETATRDLSCRLKAALFSASWLQRILSRGCEFCQPAQRRCKTKRTAFCNGRHATSRVACGRGCSFASAIYLAHCPNACP